MVTASGNDMSTFQWLILSWGTIVSQLNDVIGQVWGTRKLKFRIKHTRRNSEKFDTHNIQIHDYPCALSWLRNDTSIRSCWVKLVLWAKGHKYYMNVLRYFCCAL